MSSTRGLVRRSILRVPTLTAIHLMSIANLELPECQLSGLTFDVMCQTGVLQEQPFDAKLCFRHNGTNVFGPGAFFFQV